MYVEGLVHVTALTNDYYHFDVIAHTLTGERSGSCFRLGDQINVVVSRVDLDDRKIELQLVGKPAAAGPGQALPKHSRSSTKKKKSATDKDHKKNKPAEKKTAGKRKRKRK